MLSPSNVHKSEQTLSCLVDRFINVLKKVQKVKLEKLKMITCL